MPYAILLKSSYTTNLTQEKNQDKISQILTSKGLRVKCIDGALPERKQDRSGLWEISQAAGGPRGYPLVFGDDNGSITFIGDFDAVVELVEVEEFDQVFSGYEQGKLVEDVGQ